MGMSIEDFNALRDQVSKLQSQVDRAEGALQQTMETLKEEFGCETIEEAEKLAEQMRKETEALESKFEKAKEAFDAKWEEVLVEESNESD